MEDQKALALALLKDAFEPDTLQICALLLNSGPLQLTEIMRRSSFDFISLKPILVLLLHNNILKYLKPADDSSPPLYQLNISEILMRLRYPKFKLIANRLLGKLESEVIEQVMNMGSCTVSEAVETLAPLMDDGLQNPKQIGAQLEKAFKSLVEQGFLQRVVNFEILDPVKLHKQKTFTEIKFSAGIKQEEATQAKGAKRGSKLQSKIKLRETRAKKSSMKEQLAEFVKQETKEVKQEYPKGNNLLEEVGSGEELHFRVNSRRFIHELRTYQIVELMTTRFQYPGGLLAKAILNHSKDYEPSTGDDDSPAQYFTASEALSWMDEQSQKMMSQSMVARLLDKISKDSSEFIQMKDYQYEGGTLYALNRHALVTRLRLNLLDATVEEIFQAYHGRLFRVLRHKGYLDEKQVSFGSPKLARISLVNLKETRSILSDLYQNGFIHSQEVPQQRGGVVLMYHVDLNLALLKIKQKVLKAMLNYKERLLKDEANKKLTAMLVELDDSLLLLSEF